MVLRCSPGPCSRPLRACETWGRSRSSRAMRDARAAALERSERASAIRPTQVVGLATRRRRTTRRSRGRGERASRRNSAVRGDAARRSARPSPARCTRAAGSRSSSAASAARSPAERADRGALGEAGPDPAARRGARAAPRLTVSPIPRRARTAACGRTARASARASAACQVDQDGHLQRHQRVAASSRGRGSRRSKDAAPPGERWRRTAAPRPRRDVDPHVELAPRAPRTTTGSSGRGRRTARRAASCRAGRRAGARSCHRFSGERGRQPLAEGVADLGDDAGELAAPVAVVEADRVEHVAEHAQVRHRAGSASASTPCSARSRRGRRGGRGRGG